MIQREGRYFRASMDATALVTTVLITVLFAWVAAIQFSVIRKVSDSALAPTMALVTLVLIYGLSYAFRVKGYVITADELLVLRPLGTKHFSLQDIHSAEALVRKDLFWSIRTFGVGGLFGYYGKFYSSRFRSMTWYLTRRDATVLLRIRNGKKIVLSPDDTSDFMNAIQPFVH